MIGVVSVLYSVALPKLSTFHVQATFSSFKLSRLSWSRAEYRVLPASPPVIRHSPVLAPCCAATLPATNSRDNNTTTFPHRNNRRAMVFSLILKRSRRYATYWAKSRNRSQKPEARSQEARIGDPILTSEFWASGFWLLASGFPLSPCPLLPGTTCGLPRAGRP